MPETMLRQLADSHHIAVPHVHVLGGEVRQELPKFVTKMRYDLVAIGPPEDAGQPIWRFSAPTLMEALQRTGCDLLIVKGDESVLQQTDPTRDGARSRAG